MATFTFQFVQRLPIELEKAWSFFCNPSNLQLITPLYMDFRIISQPATTIYPGQLIQYKVKPIAGISVYWMTEITHVENMKYFIDEQRYGPYQFWHHQHHFNEINGGVEMIDIIHYRNPLGLLGSLANKLFVKKQLEYVFKYRFKQIEKMFGYFPDKMVTK